MLCQFCRREVHATVHAKNGAIVDYFLTVTGPGSFESQVDPTTGEETSLLRVAELAELATCRNCWSVPAVQSQLKQIRRSGMLPETTSEG